MKFGLNIGPCSRCSRNPDQQRRRNYGNKMSLPALVLLPPSERKAPGGEPEVHRDSFAGLLAMPRDGVREALRCCLETMTPEQLSRLFGVRGELFERAQRSMNAIVAGRAEVMPAWRRYTGVVWEHLDPSTLKSSARSRILVPSGLYGMTRATDDIADYRLTMHVALPGIGSLGRFWAEPVSEVLSGLRGHPTIVSLLPKEHARAVVPGSVASFLEAEFLAVDGKGAAGHAAKAVKGRFARHLIEHGVDDILGFRFDGWKISRSDNGFNLVAPR